MSTIYIVWGYDQYYPTGPDDIRGVFFNREAAERLVEELSSPKSYDFIHITEETVQ